MVTQAESYPARLIIDYPERLDRFSTFFRLIWIIPIAIIASLLSATSSSGVTTVAVTETGTVVSKATESGGGVVAGLFAATVLMIVFRERYPRWWFDFGRELARFTARVGAYLVLLTDQYPSTVDEQSVHLEIDYPDVEQDLNRWLPLVKVPNPDGLLGTFGARSKLNSTSSAVKGLPSCHLTPWRSLNSQVVLSSAFHEVARPGKRRCRSSCKIKASKMLAVRALFGVRL